MKLANLSLAKKVSASKVNFLSHMKYYLAVLIAVLVSAIFIVSFLGIRLDFDYAGGTVLTVVVDGVQEEGKYNETCNKIDEILKSNNLEVSSYQLEETAFGDAVVVKVLNKDTAKNEAVKNAINAEFGYNAEDLVQKNYVKAVTVDGTAIYGTKMAAVALSVAIVVLALAAIFRYDLSTAINYLVSILLDLVILLSMIIICRIPINFSITAAFVFVFVLSSLFKLLFFKQAKQNVKDENLKDKTRVEIANLTLREIFSPLVVISIVCVIALILLAGLGTLQLRAFAIPALIGVVFSALTTFYLTPYLWEKINIKRRVKSKKN